MNCKKLKAITKGCDDNNLGSIKKIWIADLGDISAFEIEDVDATTDPGMLANISLESTAEFVEFTFGKNTSSYTENWQGDIAADVHLWASEISIGLRRIEVSKRNAIAVLAEGRRPLVVVVMDNNDEFRVFGLDDGMRLTAMESGTNETREAGTFYTITLSGEDRWLAPFATTTVLGTVIPELA